MEEALPQSEERVAGGGYFADTSGYLLHGDKGKGRLQSVQNPFLLPLV